MFELSSRIDEDLVDGIWPVEDLGASVHYERELLPWLIARDPKRGLGLGLGSPLHTRCLLPFALGLPFLDLTQSGRDSRQESSRKISRVQWEAFILIWGPERALATKLEASFVFEGFGNEPSLLPCYFGRSGREECEQALKAAAARAMADVKRLRNHDKVAEGKQGECDRDNKKRDQERKRLCSAARGHFLVRESISQPGCLALAYTNARISRSSGRVKVRGLPFSFARSRVLKNKILHSVECQHVSRSRSASPPPSSSTRSRRAAVSPSPCRPGP